MCYKIVEKYACDHNSDDTIPCEGFMETGTCIAQDQAKQDKVTEHEEKCRECTHFDNEMKKLNEDTELSKPVEKTAPKHNDGPKLYFKYCTRFQHCQHIGDPISTDIERLPDEAELIESSAGGGCPGCCQEHPQKIAEMKKDGSFYTDDPWGVMAHPAPAAAGSSSQGIYTAAPKAEPEPKAEPPSVPFDAVDEEPESPEDQARQAGYATGAPTSFGQSRSPSPAPKKKGKGRAGMPDDTYASRYGAAPAQEEEDRPEHSDDEDEDPRGRGAGKKQSHKVEHSDDEDEDPRGRDARKEQSHKAEPSDDEDEDPRGRAAAKPHSRDSSPEANVQPREKSYSPGPDHLISGGLPEPAKEDAAPEGTFISQDDRKKYGIKPDMVVTKELYEIFKEREKAVDEARAKGL